MDAATSRNGLAVTPWIAHERLDDEVVAINLESGMYIALDDVAADCWTLLVAGGSADEIAHILVERYLVDATDARRDVDRFLEDAIHQGLVARQDSAPPGDPFVNPLPSLSERRPYVAPVVQAFDDLEELLRLDPVHEVDEVGWPVARGD